MDYRPFPFICLHLLVRIKPSYTFLCLMYGPVRLSQSSSGCSNMSLVFPLSLTVHPLISPFFLPHPFHRFVCVSRHVFVPKLHMNILELNLMGAQFFEVSLSFEKRPLYDIKPTSGQDNLIRCLVSVLNIRLREKI